MRQSDVGRKRVVWLEAVILLGLILAGAAFIMDGATGPMSKGSGDLTWPIQVYIGDLHKASYVAGAVGLACAGFLASARTTGTARRTFWSISALFFAAAAIVTVTAYDRPSAVIMSWNANFPPDDMWKTRDEWIYWHDIRQNLLKLSFATLIIGIFCGPKDRKGAAA